MNSQTEKTTWKNEQLVYFKEYIKSFKPESKEYKRLCHDIEILEKA